MKWLTGKVSWVWPCQVLVVSAQDEEWQDGEGDQESSDWETVGSESGAAGLAEGEQDTSDVMAQVPVALDAYRVAEGG